MPRTPKQASVEPPPEPPEEIGSAVEKTYQAIQKMVLAFEIMPGERVNESALSRRLGVSRTPLREALARLASAGFLEVVPSKGYFRRKIRPKEVYDLIELRIAIESAAGRAAVVNATDEEIARLGQIVAELHEAENLPAAALIPKDEVFHETLTGLSGNEEMLRVLRATNVRVRALRYLGVESARLERGRRQHKAIWEALRERDGDRLAAVMAEHIRRPLDDIERAVRELYGRIYVA